MNKKLFRLLNLPFAVNIILPISAFLAGSYPYPALFINQSDTYNDFYAICYWTFNKVGTYGEAYRNIYPPFAHLPCLLFSGLFPNLPDGQDIARLVFPNFVPLVIIYLVTAASFFLAFKQLRLVLGLKDGWFIPWCMVASSPFLLLLDRGNLLAVNIICLNLIICLLCSPRIKYRMVYILMLAAVPVATKPYLVLNYIAFPVFSILAVFMACALNIVAIIIWQPHAVQLIISNIRSFTDTSGLFVSIPAIIVDGQAFTSFRQYSKTLLQALEYSTISSSALYAPIQIALYICLAVYYTYILSSVVYLFLIGLRFRFGLWIRSKVSVLTDDDRSGLVLESKLTVMMVATATYALVIGILPVLTKSIYWYGVCHLLPCIMIADAIIYTSKALFRPSLIVFYQFIKVLVLTNLVYPAMSRLCESEPFHRRFINANAAFLSNLLNHEYTCPTPGFESIAQFTLRMINLPLLCIITAYILLRYLQAARCGLVESPLYINEQQISGKLSPL